MTISSYFLSGLVFAIIAIFLVVKYNDIDENDSNEIENIFLLFIIFIIGWPFFALVFSYLSIRSLSCSFIQLIIKRMKKNNTEVKK